MYGNNCKELGHYFIEIDKDKYGIIKNITDKDYYTNSCNDIEYNALDNNCLERLKIEKNFQNTLLGGNHISLKLSTIEEIDSLIKFIYENILFINLIKINN